MHLRIILKTAKRLLLWIWVGLEMLVFVATQSGRGSGPPTTNKGWLSSILAASELNPAEGRRAEKPSSNSRNASAGTMNKG